MRVPRVASRGANLCLLLLLLLHLSGTLARSYWGHNRGAGGQRRGGGHQGRRNMGRHRRKDQLIHPTTAEIPYFDPTSPTHIKAQMGSSAYLPCKIKNLGNKSVSWVRNKDAHIISVDRYTFIQDARFATWHEAVTNTWTLQVKYVRASDAGRYECQVSTEPKMSHFVHLNVVVPSVTIPGGSELHVRSGSTVTIKCVVSQALHPPSYVFWYHGEQRIPEGNWKGVTQEPLSRRPSGGSEGSLTITSVNHAHAGNYTCVPAALTPVSVILHVLNGERPAAMQHGTSSSSLPSPPLSLLFLLPLLLLLRLGRTSIPSSHLTPSSFSSSSSTSSSSSSISSSSFFHSGVSLFCPR